MMVSRLLLATTLAFCVAPRSDAQRVAPVALRSADAAPAYATSTANPAPTPDLSIVPAPALAPAPMDKLAPSASATAEQGSRFSPTGTIVGGVLGGAAGTVAGFFIGAAAAEGCVGEDCGMVSTIIGSAIGEAVGLAVGAHLGSRSPHHGNLILTTLASAAIGVGGAALGVAIQGAGVVMIPLTPALQLATVYAIERH